MQIIFEYNETMYIIQFDHINYLFKFKKIKKKTPFFENVLCILLNLNTYDTQYYYLHRWEIILLYLAKIDVKLSQLI